MGHHPKGGRSAGDELNARLKCSCTKDGPKCPACDKTWQEVKAGMIAVALCVKKLHGMLSESCVPCSAERADAMLAEVLRECFTGQYPGQAEDFANLAASIFKEAIGKDIKFSATFFTLTKFVAQWDKNVGRAVKAGEEALKKLDAKLPTEDPPAPEAEPPGDGKIITP